MSDHNLPPLNPQKGEWDEEAINRRRFLTAGFWTVSGITTLIIGGTGARFFVGNALDPKPEQWVTVATLTDLPPGQVHRASFTVRTFDAWREVEKKGLLYAYSDDGVEYTVVDATCTHLGCNVRWQESEARFACPCHGGFFTREGEVIDGPPPGPLRRLETKIQNNVLMALV